MLDASESSDRRKGERRRRGRRTVDPHGGPSKPVTVVLPEAQHTRLTRIAIRLGVSLPVLIRRALARELPSNLHI